MDRGARIVRMLQGPYALAAVDDDEGTCGVHDNDWGLLTELAGCGFRRRPTYPRLHRRAVAQGGSAVALKRDAQRRPRKDDAKAQRRATRRKSSECGGGGDHGREPAVKKGSEVRGLIPSARPEQSRSDSPRQTNQAAFRLAGASQAQSH
jgi:hypothetical protein